MKILVSGENSQLGKEFLRLKFNLKNYSFLFTDSKSMNLLDKESIRKKILSYNPDIIINFSGYTNVDSAEENKLDCYEINAIAPGFISSLANKIGAYFIHISTDYVFGDPAEAPFNCEANTLPVNFYGNSKLDGEKEVFNNSPSSIIIRTSSLFGIHNDNFVKSILDKILKKQSLKIVSDQKVSMTYSLDLAKFILQIINEKDLNFIIKSNRARVIHYTNIGYTNWYDVACHINDSISKENQSSLITAIKLKDWKSKALRSLDTRLVIDYGLFDSLNIELYDWKVRVSRVVNELILNKVKND